MMSGVDVMALIISVLGLVACFVCYRAGYWRGRNVENARFGKSLAEFWERRL